MIIKFETKIDFSFNSSLIKKHKIQSNFLITTQINQRDKINLGIIKFKIWVVKKEIQQIDYNSHNKQNCHDKPDGHDKLGHEEWWSRRIMVTKNCLDGSRRRK